MRDYIEELFPPGIISKRYVYSGLSLVLELRGGEEATEAAMEKSSE